MIERPRSHVARLGGTGLCATLKKALAHRQRYRTRTKARATIFACIEVVCSRERVPLSPGFVLPAGRTRPGAVTEAACFVHHVWGGASYA
jgi:hypothetical protein